MEGKSDLSKKVVDISGAVGHMVPGMVAGVIAPGSKLASMGTFMTTAAGGYYRDGLNRGMTEQNALNYATLMGGLEGASESLSFGKLGEGIKTLSKGAIKEGLIDAGIGILENATQEALMEPAGEITSGIFGGESTFKNKNGNVNIFNKESWKELAPRMIESGIDGALVYVLLGGIGAGYTKANQIGTKISQGEQITQAEINDAVNEMKEAGMPVEEIKQKFNNTVEQIEKTAEMLTGQEKTTDINSPRIDFLNEGNINTSLENSENTLYNNNRGDINENNTRNEQYDKRRIQELLEKYQRGESISTPDGTKLSGISQNQKARERTAKIELINYANSYAKLELNATEQNLKNIINNLGGNVVFYELGNDNIWPGLANGETFYIDTIGGESVENIFYHEITHFLRQNKNNIYMKEIQPIVDEIAKDYENYQEIIFNYANSKEFFSVKDLDGTRQNELAEEVVADYIASIYSNLETNYGLSDDMIQKIKNSMDQILNRENSKMSSFSMQQNMQVPDLIKADNSIIKQQQDKIAEDVSILNMSNKAQKYQSKKQNQFINKLTEKLQVSKYANKELLNTTVDKLVENIRNNTLTEDIKTDIFNKLYSDLVKIDDAYYNENKDLKNSIRKTKLYVSEELKNSIPDYNEFRKSNLGNVTLTSDKGNISIDTFYKELNETNPELFPETIINEADQLNRIIEVQNDISKVEKSLEAYNDEVLGKEYKKWAREDFDKTVEILKKDIAIVDNYEQEKKNKEIRKQNLINEKIDTDTIKELYKQQKQLKKEYDKVYNKELLTDKDKVQLDRLIKGEIELNEISDKYNIKAIKTLYDVKKPLEDINEAIKMNKEAIRTTRYETAERLTNNSS